MDWQTVLQVSGPFFAHVYVTFGSVYMNIKMGLFLVRKMSDLLQAG